MATEPSGEWKEDIEKIFYNLLDVLRTWLWKAPNIFQYSMHFLLYDAASDERRARIKAVLNVLSAKELKMHNFSFLQDKMTSKIVFHSNNNQIRHANESRENFPHSSSEFMLSLLMHLHNDVVECF